METQEERADRLAAVAVELVTRVRDDAPEANWRWFLDALPHPVDREAVAFILAAAVPVDVPWRHLTRWVSVPVYPPRLKPCGTRAAYLRHKAHREKPCQACVDAYREFERDRMREKRSA